MISGKIVKIITGLVLIDLDKRKEICDVDTAEVKIKKLSSPEISNYIKTKEPMDKAGAFAVQGVGAALIEWSRGDYHGILGLPLFKLAKNLRKLGIKVL
jgi:septum formation protein